MLDIILFSLCVGVTNCMSLQQDTVSQAAADSVGKSHKSSSGRELESYIGQSPRAEINSPNDAPGSYILSKASHIIFRTTLLLSLWLFCLSILEAAPSSWLLFIHETSSFVLCYRINLWALCISLEIIIPIFLGLILVVKLVGNETIRPTPNSPTLPPSKLLKPPSIRTLRVRDKYRAIFHLVRIGTTFIFAFMWYITKREISICLFSGLLKRDQSATTNSKDVSRRRGHGCMNNGRLKQNGALKVTLFVMFALAMSFWLLGTLSTIVISDSSNIYAEDKSGPNSHDRKHKLGQYYVWVIGPHSPLKLLVKMACALGMIIASLLNGFGCVSMPHANLIGMYLQPTSTAVLAKVEEDYFYVVQNLKEKKYMLSGLVHLSSSVDVPADSVKIKQLRDEISFLENLVGDMSDDIDEMKHSQQLALKARTTYGYISWILGIIFSIILVFRVVLAVLSFMHKPSASGRAPSTLKQHRDPITVMVLWLTGCHVVTDEQYNLYLQGTSLLLAGILTISQIRVFFRVVEALVRKMSHVLGVSLKQKTDGDLSLIFFSFVMGCYFLSCVVIVKMTLPLEYRSSFSSALGKFDFGFNAAVLNMVFCASTCTSAITLGFLFGIQRKNSERYNVEATLASQKSFSQDSAQYTA